MVDIRKVTRETLPDGDLDKLVDLYLTCFSERIQPGTEQKNSEEDIKDALDNRTLHVAYEGKDIAGFLVSDDLTGSLAALFDLAINFSNFRDKSSHYQVDLAILGFLARGACSNTLPEKFIEEGKIRSYMHAPFSNVQPGDIIKYATAVHPEHRSNGVARDLSMTLAEEARQREVRHIFTLCTNDPHIRAMNDSLGYLPIVDIEPFYADGTKTTLMVKDFQ